MNHERHVDLLRVQRLTMGEDPVLSKGLAVVEVTTTMVLSALPLSRRRLSSRLSAWSAYATSPS